MFILAEVISGVIYALDDFGGIWKISLSPCEGPTFEMLTNISMDKVNELSKPKLLKFVEKFYG